MFSLSALVTRWLSKRTCFVKMDGFKIENIVQSISKTCCDTRNAYLDVLDGNCILNTNNNVAAQSITSLLGTKRAIGLRLLVASLSQCSGDLLERKGSLWLTLILKACNKKEISAYGVLIFEALAQLFKKLKMTTDLSKLLTTAHLTKIFESLRLIDKSGNSSCITAALHAVKQCLRHFPGLSKPCKATAQRFLIALLDSSNPDIVHQSGECWLLLQQIRGSGASVANVGANEKTQWLDFQLGLLGNLHYLLNETFAVCSDVNDSPISGKKLEHLELKLKGDPLQRAAQVSRRFKNLVEYLKIALSHPFPVKKTIHQKKILNLIQRGLGVAGSSYNNNPNIDKVCFGTFLPEMQAKLLELLAVLIEVCHTHLRMHFRLVLNILLDTLKRTKTGMSEASPKLLVNLRLMVYKIISLWCSTFKTGSRSEIISEGLIQEILTDTLPHRSSFLLTPSNKNVKRSAKQKNAENKRQLSQQLQQKGNLTEVGNQSICQSALCCLQEVFLSAGHILKPTIITDVHNKILGICVQFYELPVPQEHIYSNWRCRMEIYKTLSALITMTNYRVPPPTEIILHILKVACIADKDAEIRTACRDIIHRVENIVHPQKESLIFPPERNVEQNQALYDKTLQDLTNQSILTEESYEKEIESLESDSSVNMDTTEIEETKQNEISTKISENILNTALNTVNVEDAEENSTSEDDIEPIVELHPIVSHENNNQQSKLLKPPDNDDWVIVQELKKPAPQNCEAQINGFEQESEQGTNMCTQDDDQDMIAELEAAFIDELK